MNKPNIVFLDEYSISGCDTSAIERLGNYTGYEFTSPEQTIPRCADADIIIANKTVINRDVIEALPKLKLICVAATGVNNVDIEAATERGIPVKNAVGYSTNAVAETTIAGALSLYRQIDYYDNFVKSGDWSRSGRQFHFGRPLHQLSGSNWGIIGLGNIGREVAKIATVMGCNVRYTSTSGVIRNEDYPHSSLAELLAWADVISLHCPLTPSTQGIINEESLNVMKPTAIIINVARGGVIDEQALALALNRGTITGAVVDVFEQEPTAATNPLLSIDDPYKIILSPHNAWAPMEAIHNLLRCIENNIKGFCA